MIVDRDTRGELGLGVHRIACLVRSFKNKYVQRSKILGKSEPQCSYKHGSYRLIGNQIPSLKKFTANSALHSSYEH